MSIQERKGEIKIFVSEVGPMGWRTQAVSPEPGLQLSRSADCTGASHLQPLWLTVSWPVPALGTLQHEGLLPPPLHLVPPEPLELGRLS